MRRLPAGQQRAWLLSTLSHKDISYFRRRVAFRRRQPDLYRRYQPTEPDPEQQALSEGTVAAEVRNIRRRLIDEMGPYYPFGGEGEVSS